MDTPRPLIKNVPVPFTWAEPGSGPRPRGLRIRFAGCNRRVARGLPFACPGPPCSRCPQEGGGSERHAWHEKKVQPQIPTTPPIPDIIPNQFYLVWSFGCQVHHSTYDQGDRLGQDASTSSANRNGFGRPCRWQSNSVLHKGVLSPKWIPSFWWVSLLFGVGETRPHAPQHRAVDFGHFAMCDSECRVPRYHP